MTRIGFSIKQGLVGLALCAGLLGAPARADVVHHLEGGLLTGADNVLVNGASYDVIFQDGSCDSLQLGCTLFTFDNAIDALAAAQALLDQVFTGLFDFVPNLTRGCTLAGGCLVSTIYGVGTPGPALNLATTQNSAAEPGDAVTHGLIGRSFDTARVPAATVAVWSTSKPAQVPEPASIVLLAAGLAVMGAGVRRQRR